MDRNSHGLAFPFQVMIVRAGWRIASWLLLLSVRSCCCWESLPVTAVVGTARAVPNTEVLAIPL